ncbi:hypothetical protein TIFTF001_007270 [Ficus carica]|uniref:RRM domain-containing protein n=1 Tax=Ficus carica TaxID=3494 RepID=A0AA87ZKW7_FICCA|nr:hypothetical protein TIFTF001_007270 [Ficus carica]
MSSRASRTLYVGNLPGDIREREVEDLFYKYGRIAHIDLKVPPRPPGYAFVEFEDARDAEDAIRGRDGYDFDGHRLRVELAHGGRGHSSSTDRYSSHGGGRGGRGVSRRSDYRVLVTGLPSSASWQDLKDHMRRAGDVCFSQVFRDGSGTTGIVDYTNFEDMKYAIKKLDDSEFRNAFSRSYVRVREYDSKRDSSKSPTRGQSHSRDRSYSRSRSRSRASLQKPNLHVAHLLNQDQGQDLGRAQHRGPAPRQAALDFYPGDCVCSVEAHVRTLASIYVGLILLLCLFEAWDCREKIWIYAANWGLDIRILIGFGSIACNSFGCGALQMSMGARLGNKGGHGLQIVELDNCVLSAIGIWKSPSICNPDQDPDLHYLPNMQVKAPRSAAPAKVPAEAGAGARARAYPGEIFYHGKLASGSEALEVKPEDLILSDLLGSSVCGVDFKLKSVPSTFSWDSV